MEISFGRRRRPENFGGIYKNTPPYLRQFWKKGGILNKAGCNWFLVSRPGVFLGTISEIFGTFWVWYFLDFGTDFFVGS